MVLSFALAACGGGGGSDTSGNNTSSGTSTATTAAAAVELAGSAVDNPIANAQITITAGAPLGDSGSTTIGAITASSDAGFTVSVTLPAMATPIFANATDPNNITVVLTSYLGQSTDFASATSLTDTSLPNLDISPVTTAALAVYAQINGGNYVGLTRATYASTLQTYASDVLVIAAAIKAVGDDLCTPSATISSTTNLAAAIAASANLTSGTSTTLSAAAAALGGNCATALATVPQAISADPLFGPQLSIWFGSGATLQSALTGTWQLQGLLAETGFDAQMTAATISGTPPTAAAPSVFSDAAVTISTSGAVTSADGNVTGTVTGNLVNLTVIAGSQTYTLRGALATIPTSLTSGGTAYALQAGGFNSGTNVLTAFPAVLAPVGATPVWNGIAVPSASSQSQGVTCATGQPVLLGGFIDGVGGGTVGECIVPGVSGWTMNAPTSMVDPFGFSFFGFGTQSTAPTLTATTWTETAATPFILTDTSASFTLTGSTMPTSGQTYYVMGSPSLIFTTPTSTGSLNQNSMLNIFDNPLTRMSLSAYTGY